MFENFIKLFYMMLFIYIVYCVCVVGDCKKFWWVGFYIVLFLIKEKGLNIKKKWISEVSK